MARDKIKDAVINISMEALNDTPDFSGQDGKIVKVDEAQDRLVYENQYPSMIGNPGFFLQVNSGATEVQWADSATLNIVTKISDYSILTTNQFIVGNGNSAGVTLTLPTAIGIEGKYYIIKATDITNTVKINTTNSQTIDGNLEYIFTSQNEAIFVISDGSNWLIF